MKNYDQAVSDYSKALSKNNKYTEATLALASIELDINKPEFRPCENCNAVIAYAPDNQQAYIVRSRYMPNLPNTRKPLTIYPRSCMTTPRTRKCTCYAGTYYQEFIQHQNAISDFTQALQIDNGLCGSHL